MPGMSRLQELEVLRHIHPKLTFNEDKRLLFEEIEAALRWYELLYLDIPIERWSVYFFGLLDHLSDTELRELLDRLGFHGNESDKWSERKIFADRTLKALLRESDPTPSRIYTLMSSQEMDALLYLIAKTKDHEKRRALSQFITRDRNIRPLIGGEDLKELGLKPGPIFRKALDTLRDARLDGKVITRDDELAYLKNAVLPVLEDEIRRESLNLFDSRK